MLIPPGRHSRKGSNKTIKQTNRIKNETRIKFHISCPETGYQLYLIIHITSNSKKKKDSGIDIN